MNDEYQSMAANAICHAVTQAGYSWQMAAGMAESVVIEQKRPFMLLKPKLFPEGNQWCALYGENLQDGVCAFGDTPDAASKQFDIEWLNAKCGANRGV